MKKSTIEYRRGKTTRSPWTKKAKGTYRYPDWVRGTARYPDELVTALQANLLFVFPRLSLVAPERRAPHWLWTWTPRQAT